MKTGRTRKSWLARAVLVAATALGAVAATRVQVQNDLQSWFVDGDPAAARYAEFVREFGSDEMLLVALDCQGPVFRTATLQRIERLTEVLDAHAQVRNVISLSTIHVLREEERGPRVGDLAHLWPFEHTEAAELQEHLEAEPLSYASLVGPDGTVTTLYVRMEAFEDEGLRAVTLGELRSLLEQELAGTSIEYHLAGTGLIFEAVNELSGSDLAGTFLAALALSAVLMRIALSNWRRTAVALLGALLAALWSLGLFGLTQTPLNLVTSMAPTLVAIVALAHAVHLLGNRAGALPGVTGAANRRRVLRACVFSALTSGVAFLALLCCDVQVLRELGWTCGVGVMLGLAAPWLLTLAMPRLARPPA